MSTLTLSNYLLRSSCDQHLLFLSAKAKFIWLLLSYFAFFRWRRGSFWRTIPLLSGPHHHVDAFSVQFIWSESCSGILCCSPGDLLCPCGFWFLGRHFLFFPSQKNQAASNCKAKVLMTVYYLLCKNNLLQLRQTCKVSVTTSQQRWLWFDSLVLCIVVLLVFIHVLQAQTQTFCASYDFCLVQISTQSLISDAVITVLNDRFINGEKIQTCGPCYVWKHRIFIRKSWHQRVFSWQMQAETLSSFWSAEVFGLELSHNAIPVSFLLLIHEHWPQVRQVLFRGYSIIPGAFMTPWMVDRMLLGQFPLLPFLSVCG